MTEKDLEIQKLRRDVARLVKDNVKLQTDYDALQLVRQLDMAEVVRLRRISDMLEEEIAAKDERIAKLVQANNHLMDALAEWNQGQVQ